MNIFITGGAGYIGSTAAEALRDLGHQVTVYDSLVSGYRAAIPEGVNFIQADLGDRQILNEALQAQSYDAIFHFAAFIEAGESMKNPGKYFKNNLGLSLQLIESAHQAGVKRFILSSTAAVYQSSDEPIDEVSPLGPQNVYGQTKLMIEQVLNWYRKLHGMHYAALRYFNASGALPHRGEAHQPETHLIPLTLQVPLEQREKIYIYGTDYATPDGTCIRDYIHISDLVSAHVLALDALETRDQLVYNLGNGAGYSVREVVDAAREVTGHVIAAEETPRRPGDAPRLVASSDRIRRELGWEPKIPSIRDIIASAWEWHRANPDGYQAS